MANTLSYIGYAHAPSGSEDYSFKYSAAFTGSYTSGTAESLNFLTAANTNGLELNGFVPSGTGTTPPEFTANLGGYTANVGPLTNGTVAVKFYSAGGTELTTGAFPAGITSGNIIFRINTRG
jgi:hypothetical protein